MKLKKIIGVILTISMLPAMAAISYAEEQLTVRIDGIGIPGETLTAVVSGAPENEEITYQWYYGPVGTTDKRTKAITKADSSEWNVSLEDCIAVSYLTGKFADWPVWVKVTCGEQSVEVSTYIAPGRNDGAAYKAIANSVSDNVFSAGGKEFIVLDSNENEMFILAKDDYGKHLFDSVTSNRYSTTRETNIGYWLNNDFLENGNGEGVALPDGIKRYINEHTWTTNNIVSTAGKSIETTEDTAKLALMSIEEFNKYSGRYGVADSMSFRWWLRSSSSDLQTLAADISKANGYTGRINNQLISSVRPVFYLDKSVFANVKIDVNSAGSEIKDIIRSTYPDYKSLSAAGYTDDELTALGYELPEIIKAERFDFENDPALEYNDAVGFTADIAGNGTTYTDLYWYLSNNNGTTYKELTKTEIPELSGDGMFRVGLIVFNPEAIGVSAAGISAGCSIQ